MYFGKQFGHVDKFTQFLSEKYIQVVVIVQLARSESNTCVAS